MGGPLPAERETIERKKEAYQAGHSRLSDWEEAQNLAQT